MSEERWQDLVDLDARRLDGSESARRRADRKPEPARGRHAEHPAALHAGGPRLCPAPLAGTVRAATAMSPTGARRACWLLSPDRYDVPRLIAACSERTSSAAPFYLMGAVDGFNAVVKLDPLHKSDRDIRRQMGFALVDGALALSRADHVAVGCRLRKAEISRAVGSALARLARFLSRLRRLARSWISFRASTRWRTG